MKPGEDTQNAQADHARTAPAGPWWRDAVGMLIAAVGGALCVKAYLAQHSLFIDEARLLENILSRSWSELTQPLTQEQAAPVGFLYLVKLSIGWIGDDKLGFRAVPMAAAVASMFLFWILIRQLVRGWPAWFGMAVFAAGSSTAYYAQQTKQYTVELMVALLLLGVMGWIAKRGLSGFRLLVFAVVGALATWLAVTAVMVLAGCGVVLLVLAVRGKRPGMVAAVLGVGVLWVGSFLGQYALVLSEYRGSDYLVDYWKNFYLRLNPRLPHKIFGQLGGVFIHPVDLQLHQLGLVLWGLGLWAAAVSRRALPWAIVLGWLTLGLMSFLGHYPYGDRQVLFALPLLIGPMTMGLAWINEQGRHGRTLAVVLALAVVSGPIFTAGSVEVDDDLEPVMLELAERVQPGDVVWVDRGAMYMVSFLQARSDDFDLAPAVVQYTQLVDGQRHWAVDEIRALDGQPRVWLLMSHAIGRQGVDEINFVLLLAKQQGRQLDEITAGKNSDTSATLFDFTADPTPAPTPAGPPPDVDGLPTELSDTLTPPEPQPENPR
ncbi:hypothetical protein [Algisphaera agarilytica]|uniref:Glycosyltransferase RgtA/B/C/D-like domain-containing protein n=1 Tax=Algisphaera agarilytica TaxID=1385975 RepID=A0A7X0H497_9BACT|nr:hypothetical protein [Algisphaera agarilytica]MBB6429023.1 hypothetical protein [Algisphaera agarilytica]